MKSKGVYEWVFSINLNRIVRDDAKAKYSNSVNDDSWETHKLITEFYIFVPRNEKKLIFSSEIAENF